MQFNHFYQKNKVTFWLVPIILTLFFFLRLYNLTIIPVFVDEAIYIRWSQVMRAEQTLRFLPLSDGKQPLFMWLTIPFLKIFSDPLVAGRIVSVLAGLGTLGGTFLLVLVLTGRIQVALISAFLYAIIPFSVFFDRMALADSLLSCFGVWTLVLGVLLIRYRRLDLAMITGMVLGGALLTKSPAIFFAILLPATVVLLNYNRHPERKRRISLRFFAPLSGAQNDKGRMSFLLIKIICLWIVVYLFAFGVYNILRLGPNFQMIALRNKDYIFPLSHFWENPLDPLVSHLKEIWLWMGTFLTWPVFGLSFLGVLRGLRRERRVMVLLLVWLLPPLLVQAEYAKVFTSRYILFAVPYVLVLGSLGCLGFFGELKGKKRLGLAGWLMVAVLLVWPLWFDFLLLTQPQTASLPEKMRSGYLEEWTSGYGIKEVADYLKIEAQKGRILVGTEGFFGTLPDGLQIYLEKIPNITIIGVGYPITQIPKPLTNSLADNRVFLLVNDSRLNLTEPELQKMKLIAAYPKAVKSDGSQERLMFYEILQ